MQSYSNSSCGVLGNSSRILLASCEMPSARRLQPDVDHGLLVAPQLIAQEDVFARRPAGDQQHLGLAIDDFDVDFLLVVAGVAVLGRRLDAQAIHAAAGLGRRDLELDRHDFAAPAERDALGAFELCRRRPCRRRRRRATAVRP